MQVDSLTRLTLLGALSLVFVMVLNQSLGAQGARMCSPRWSAPNALIDENERPVYVETASLIPLSGGAQLLGTPTLVWFRRDTLAPPAPITATDTNAYGQYVQRNRRLIGVRVGLRGHAVSIELPATAFAVEHPKGVQTRDSVVHVVWLESTPAEGSQPSTATLWHSTLRGSTWGPRVVLFSADQIYWNSGTGKLLSNGRDIHVVASYFQRDSGGGIVHIRRISGKWSRVAAFQPALPTYTTAALAGPDSIIVIFTAGDAAASIPNGSHLFAVKVGAVQPSWPRARRIQWSGLGAVSWPNLHGTSAKVDALLTVVWAFSPGSEASSRDSTFSMSSTDGGRTWSAPVGTVAPRGITAFTSALDAGGRVHVVLSALSGAGARGEVIWYAGVQRGRWARFSELPFGKIASSPTIARLDERSLFLSWGKAVFQAGQGQSESAAPSGMYATLNTRCLRANP